MIVSPVGDRPIRIAIIPVVLCVVLYCAYRLGFYLPLSDVDYDPGVDSAGTVLVACVIVALGAVQLQYAFRRPSHLGACALLALQVLLTYGPHLVLGARWETPGAFVVAAVLLTFTGWWSWALAASAVACDIALRIVLIPGVNYLTDEGATISLLYTGMVAAANGLLLFGLTRLSELVRDLHRTRAASAPLEVARERLRIARNLHEAVGRRLGSIVEACRHAENPQLVAAQARQAMAQVRTVADDYRERSLAGEMEAARTVLDAAGVEVVFDTVPDRLSASIDAVLASVLRRAVVAALGGAPPPRQCRIELDGSARMRVSFTGGSPGMMASDGIAADVAHLGGRLHIGARTVEVSIPVEPHRARMLQAHRPVAAAPWLAFAIMAMIELDLIVTALVRASGAWSFIPTVPPQRALLAVGMAVPLSLLQLYHVRPRSGRVPPGWRWTLAVQIVLTGILGVVGGSAFPVQVYGSAVAGVVLFHIRRPWSWILAGGLILGATFLEALNFGVSLTEILLWSWTWATYATIAIAALCRLPVTAEKLIAARQELARLAVLRERLRIARDTHDLLGFQLSAVAVKAGLAARLTTSDPGTARTHLAEAGQVAEQALQSLKSITGGEAGLSFASEVQDARSMLTAAGIGVAVELRAEPGPCVESTLAIILREAVTNVVRHSRATACRIETSAVPGGIRLQVTNDGADAPPDAPGISCGNGLVNLRARIGETGGRLCVDRLDDRFTIVAEIHGLTAKTKSSGGTVAVPA